MSALPNTAFGTAAIVSLHTRIQWTAKPGLIYNFLRHIWHFKCFAFWCCRRIFSSSKSITISASHCQLLFCLMHHNCPTNKVKKETKKTRKTSWKITHFSELMATTMSHRKQTQIANALVLGHLFLDRVSYVVQAGLNSLSACLNLLSTRITSKCWGYRHVPPCLI